jgi:glycosyltransferase involved in cell wall biosynthesis
VLIVIENMSYTYDTRVRKIARSLVRNGHTVAVLCPRYPGDRFLHRDGDVRVIHYPLPWSGGGPIGHLFEYAFSLIAIAVLSSAALVAMRFDVIHICNPPDIFFPLARLYQALGKRFVFDLHDLCPELAQVRYGQHKLLKRAMLTLERWTIRTADHVLVTSESARQCVVTRGRGDATRVTLVYNGPDLDNMPAPSGSKQQPSTLKVGYVGDINPQDGLDNLLYAADYIRMNLGRSDVRFICIGDGSDFGRMKAMVHKLGLRDVVELTGRLSPGAAMKRLAECDACVLPDSKNDFNDTCVMVKTLEYMALGKAFASFDLRETRSICGDAAVYATEQEPRALARAIVDLLDDPGRRERLGLAGQRRIRDGLTWPFCEQALLGAYRKIGESMPSRSAHRIV